MLSSKQRAGLRAAANTIETIVQVGKQGVTDTVLQQAREALLARELVKMRVLPGALLSAGEAAQSIGEALGAEVVQVIGTRFVLFKRNPDKPSAYSEILRG